MSVSNDKGPGHRMFAPFLRLTTVFSLTTVLLLAMSPIVEAQSNAPIRLGPPKKLAPEASPQKPDAPQEEVEEQKPALPATEGLGTARRAPSGFKVDDLQSVTVESVGTLSEDTGGLGANMWAGTERARVDRLIPMLPSLPPSHVMRDLQRRLLLTAAIAPAGKSTSEKSLIAARAEAAFALGLQGELDAFLAAIPGSFSDQALDRVRAKHMLVGDEPAAMCGLARSMILQDGVGEQDLWWQKLTVVCDLLEGRAEQADVGARMLIELGDNDQIFADLLQVLSGDKEAKMPLLSAPRPLDLAMMTGTGKPFPAEISGGFSSPALRAFATTTNQSFQSRLVAAELAESRGLISARDLSQVYDEISVGDSDIDGILSLVEADPGPNSRALLYRTTVSLPIDLARAQAIEKALQVGRREGRYVATVRLYLDQLLAIEASSNFAWFAHEAALAYLAVENKAQADRWLLIAKREASRNPDPEKPFDALWPYLRFNGLTDDATLEADLKAWWSALRERQPEEAADKAAFLIAVLQALGEPLSDGVWADLIAGNKPLAGEAPALQTMRAMRAAAAANRVGETVLIASIALGDQPLGALPGGVVADVISALMQVGLTDEARALALETAFANGL